MQFANAHLATESTNKDLLRFITCGSVDDGKSTLIGRLLYDSNLIPDDQMSLLSKESKRHGTTGGDIDFALLVDGLEAEREQGITIDVAYRYFATPKRSFMVADTPGHEQYTRNMATGASNAHLAIILVDARKGLLTQTMRHSFICSLLGIRHVVLAVNKIDLMSFSQEVFDRIVADYMSFASGLRFSCIIPVPISARFGDNITTPSANMSWYKAQVLLDFLESVDIESEYLCRPFRFPVQWVNRPNLDFRGYAGTIASGQIATGDEVAVASSGKLSRVDQIVTYDGPVERAQTGDAITITLMDEIDVARGDILSAPIAPPEVTDQFAAHIIWFDQDALVPGRSYFMRLGTNAVSTTITNLKYKIDVITRDHLSAKTLELNEIGFCDLSTSLPVAFDPYETNRRTGSFIVIDRYSNQTVGAGMIAYGFRRATNVKWQALTIGKAERALLKKQRPVIIWLTGFSGAGKTTIANLIDIKLFTAGRHTVLLDGDNFRHGLNRDLGFNEADRAENIRRVGEVAKLMIHGGLIAICSFISPYKADREMVRNLVGDDEFLEVFIDTPIEECIRRDPKGLYRRAKAGEISGLTGIDAPYEAPEKPEIRLKTLDQPPEQLAERLVKELVDRGIIEHE